MHRLNELLLISSQARGILFSNGNLLEIRTPALILHRAGSYHYIDTFDSQNSGYSCHCVYYEEEFVKQVPESLLHSTSLLSDDCLVIELTPDQCASMVNYAELLFSHEEKSNTSRSLFLLLLLLNEAYGLLNTSMVYRLNAPNDYIFDVVQYLIRHFNEPITTTQIAQRFHVSVSKINTDFYKITNQTLKSFCNHLKLVRAAELLADNADLPIAEIAYRCGFSSESYFIQSFQKNMGMTPNAYRKQKKNEE
jgi:AraC-like DNA-binding protein